MYKPITAAVPSTSYSYYIFIVQCYAGVVYAVVMCLSVTH